VGEGNELGSQGRIETGSSKVHRIVTSLIELLGVLAHQFEEVGLRVQDLRPCLLQLIGGSHYEVGVTIELFDRRLDTSRLGHQAVERLSVTSQAAMVHHLEHAVAEQLGRGFRCPVGRPGAVHVRLTERGHDVSTLEIDQ
jgi:hypothetical protein